MAVSAKYFNIFLTVFVILYLSGSVYDLATNQLTSVSGNIRTPIGTTPKVIIFTDSQGSYATNVVSTKLYNSGIYYIDLPDAETYNVKVAYATQDSTGNCTVLHFSLIELLGEGDINQNFDC